MKLLITAVWFAAATTALAQEKTDDAWKDTHRVVLTNGNTIDGQLGEITDEYVVIKYAPYAEISLRIEDIKRDDQGRLMIVKVEMRHTDDKEKLETVPDRGRGTDTTGTGATDTNPPNGRDPVEPIPVDGSLAAKVDKIIDDMKGDADKQPYIQRLSELSPDGLAYAAGTIKKQDPDTAQYIVAGITRWWSNTSNKDRRPGEALRGQLPHPNDQVTTSIINALRLLEVKRAVNDFKAMLASSSPEVRGASVEAIGKLGGREVVDILAPLVVDPIKQVREAAASAVVDAAIRLKYERPTFMALRAAMRKGKPEHREMVAHAIGQLKLPESAKTLMELLSSSTRDVRGAAIIALGNIQSAEAAGRLNPLIQNDKDEWIRELVADALRQIRERSSVPFLIDALAAERNNNVRIRINRALQAITGQGFQTYQDWDNWRKGNRGN